MTYGDARYQTKRISLAGLRGSEPETLAHDETPSASEKRTQAVAITQLLTTPVAARTTAGVNPYTHAEKAHTFREPIPQSDPQPAAPEFSQRVTEPTPQPVTGQQLGATRIYELAQQYVSIFQTHACKELTPEQVQALVAEVATFYSAPSRAGRLEALVNVFVS